MGVPSLNSQRFIFIDQYRATAAAGVSETDTAISVDVVPMSTLDVAAGNVAMPISILDANGDLIANTICTGWDNTGMEIYIPAFSLTGTTDPVTIICAPNRPTMELMQPKLMYVGELSGAGYTVEFGLNYYLSMTAADTITIDAPQTIDFNGCLDQYNEELTVTRIVVIDADGDQPALSWSNTIQWEAAGAPAFEIGKALLYIEILQAYPETFGSWRLYDGPTP